jgi:hypothetical protein
MKNLCLGTGCTWKNIIKMNVRERGIEKESGLIFSEQVTMTVFTNKIWGKFLGRLSNCKYFKETPFRELQLERWLCY